MDRSPFCAPPCVTALEWTPKRVPPQAKGLAASYTHYCELSLHRDVLAGIRSRGSSRLIDVRCGQTNVLPSLEPPLCQY